MNSINRFLVGCECNRSTLDTIATAGFDVISVEHDSLAEAPALVRPLVVGSTTATPGWRFGETRSTLGRPASPPT